MKLSKQQKTNLTISVVAVLVLVVITVSQKSNFGYKDTTDYAKLGKLSAEQQAAYNKYLASIETDPKASAELFQSILTKEELKQMVKDELKTDQPIVLPAVDEKSLNVTKTAGQKAVVDYFTAAIGPVVAFNKNTADLNKDLFGDTSVTESVRKEYNEAYRNLVSAPVPKEALPTQKALVAAYLSYGKLLSLSEDYGSGQNPAPWPEVYQSYGAMNQSFLTFAANYGQLANRYKLADSKLIFPAGSENQFTLIPKAHAVFGIGDVSITVGDVPRLLMDAVKEGLVSSFSKFMASFLGKIIEKIESNYKIANFLYYSDALVSGEYADDYLNKYGGDSTDKSIIKQLIPQFSCNKNNASLKPIFKAKANQHLGFDPVALDPKDPDYYQKMASLGDFLSSSQGWKIYYQDVAEQAESAAQQAIDRELTSSGLKSPREGLGGGIVSSINKIVSGEKASMEAILNLGIQNASSFVSELIAQITETLFTKFVFSGATTSPRGGSIVGVLKEQTTCLAAAQLNAIVPVEGTQYQKPSAPPSAEQLLQEACASLPRGCVTPTP